jgi:2-polyprenyl-3-methyl-5-hydroxy-6-metoxy-1,4-benzoquinol methylase
MLASLSHRRRQPELMDQPGLDTRLHEGALRGLARINRWSGSARILWPPIRALLREANGQALRVLDLASGAGDLAVGLWRRAKRSGFPIEIHGWDVSPYAVAHARRRAAEVGANVQFVQADALTTEIAPPFDVVTCSLFLHHLDEIQAVALLQRMGHGAKRLALVNDLVRSRVGWWTAYLGTRVLSTSRIVHVDGPLSVEGAFSLDEVRRLADTAGLTGATVAKRWPSRFLLTWKRA